MANGNTEDVLKDQKQPDALKELLRSIIISRKYFSLYGVDHPSTSGALEGLLAVLEEFLRSFEKATCILTEKTVIVNGQAFEPSDDSRELFGRLRDRGVMAFSFAGMIPVEEVTKFLVFLSTEPREIRDQGGPGPWLLSIGVTRIAVTEAVYAVGEGPDDGETGGSLSLDMDPAAAAVISWLCRQQDGVPSGIGHKSVSNILGDPDGAARLITEAVTKLHASRKDRSPNDLAEQVVGELKELCGGGESAEWNEAAPLVRMALGKLAKELLPTNSATKNRRPTLMPPGTKSVADVAKIGEVVNGALEDAESADWSAQLDAGFLNTLFDATPAGLLPSWREELDPAAVIVSSGRTLELLMILEEAAPEHARMSQALASMIPQAVAMNDVDSALCHAGALLTESKRDDGHLWRRSNARAALESVESGVLRAIVESALASGDYRKKETAALMVESLPGLALSLSSLLGNYEAELFDRSLRAGILAAGQGAIPRLEELVYQGAASSKSIAFDMLASMSKSAAVKVIVGAIEGGDSALAVFALGRLPALGAPQSVDLCLSALSNRDLGVRLAGIAALGEFGEESLPHLLRLARQRSFRGEMVDVRIAAIRSLVRVCLPEAVPTLEQIAKRMVLFGRNNYQPIKEEAKIAVEIISGRETLPRAA